MSSIMKGIVDENQEVSVLYIDGKPSMKYARKHEAQADAERVRAKFPNKKVEIKTEIRGGIGGNQKLGETEAKKGADGKRCWKGKRYAGTVNGKDKCIPVKEEELVEAKIFDVVRPLVKAFNLENGAEERWASVSPLSPSASSPRRWRRGDGSYYTDPSKIIALSDEDKGLQKEFFSWLTQQPGVQPAGKIRGEFRSSDYSDAVKYKGVVFIDRGAYTEFTTPSRLRNSDVWHQKTDEAANPAQQAAIAISKKEKAKANEGVIIGHDAQDPDVAVLGGAGSYKLSKLKRKAQMEAEQLAKDVAEGKFKNSAYNVKQLANTLNTIVAAEDEMEKLYFGEDYTGQFAAEKTPATNPYGGLEDHQQRGAIGEAREPSDALRAAQKNLIDLSTGEVRRREDAKRAAAKRQREYDREFNRKPKKPSLEQIWQHVEHAISNYFPDGDPTDYLAPYMERNNLTWDDITRASKKNGYKDLWDYWNTLSQDIENDAYYDWMAAKRPEAPVNPLSKDAADIQHRNWVAKKNPKIRTRGFFLEDPDTSGAVGTQPGGWRRTDMEESRYTDDVMTFAKDLHKEMRREKYDWEYIDLADMEAAIDDASEQLSMFAHSNMCDAFREYDPEDQIKLIKAFNKKAVKNEDTSYGTGMGQGGNAGESYRKFTPKSAGTYKESSIMKGIKRESK